MQPAENDNGDKAWKENKRGWRISVAFKKMAMSVDGYKRGLEQGVDLNKAWTQTRRGLEESVDLNKAWKSNKAWNSNEAWTRTLFEVIALPNNLY